MCDHADKVEYLSQMLADNAVELHRMSAPDCTTITAYPCGDHWHLGHDGHVPNAKERRAACKAAHPFPSLPFARRMHKPRRRKAA